MLLAASIITTRTRRLHAPKDLPPGAGPCAAVALWTVAGSAADKNREWPAYSGDKGSTKYSALDQINRNTIKSLKIAWRQSSVPDELKTLFPDAQGSTNWQNTPIMAGGLLYMSSAVGTVVALDPATGKVVWYDVPPHEDGKPPARAGSTRGVAYWAGNGNNDARIFAMNGPNLIALNARTGKRYTDWGDQRPDRSDEGRVRPRRRHRLPQQQRARSSSATSSWSAACRRRRRTT